jgi:serine protease Do
MSPWLALGMLVALTGAAPAAEIIELKSGHAVEGEIIKERPDELIVDIGIDIIRIPLERVARRRAAGSAANPTEKTEGFFTTAELPRSTVRALAARFGEGVVMIKTPSGLGSGFILNKQGYCVTNHHVIENETKLSAVVFQRNKGEFSRRQIEDVKIIALNPFLDLALLKIPEQKDIEFAPVFLASEDELVEGDPTFAIGNPLGLDQTVSEGIISKKNRNFEGKIYLQSTTQINPGNSGGPLFNLRGQVVGVTNMGILGGEGLGFAIPISYVKHFLENRDAFAYDPNNPNNGFRYMDAPRRRTPRK